MSFETERATLTNYLFTSWVDGYGKAKTEIALPNRNFTPPTNKAWLRYTIRNGQSRRTNLGDSPRYRHEGSLVFEIYTPRNEGNKAARDLADQMIALWRGQSFAVTDGVIWVRDAQMVEENALRDRPDDPWFAVRVTIDYRRDEVG